ncbi:hypothetical protein KP509_20G087400 [Ceratopteris richardii]|uniref:CCHC-type domain-containing protein n=1 Tax=Ceratopteris richardii TaxID=49495 RepID=A0A8T2SHV9_CERRI|nr:hypothetical protein KP509_20G087400 [Ceratopteris richardii]
MAMTYGHGAQGQEGGYPRRAAQTEGRGAGPIQCWRFHGFGHTQTRCPNEKKPIDYTPMCMYCSGEGHFDEDCPKKKANNGKGKGPIESSNYVETHSHPTPRVQEQIPTIRVVFRTPDSREGHSSSMHFVEAEPGKSARKDPIVAVVMRTQEYVKKDAEKSSENVDKEKTPKHREIDSNAPSVVVEVKGYAVPSAQLDSEGAIKLMTKYMMKALGLTHMEETPMSLRMADQTQVKPAGLLKNVSTVVGGLEFSNDYLIVRPMTSEATFSILLGWPWLVQGKCVHDWHTGFITIGPKSDRIQIQLPTCSLFFYVHFFDVLPCFMLDLEFQHSPPSRVCRP